MEDNMHTWDNNQIREFYDNKSDPYQLQNILLQPATAASFDGKLGLLRGCTGQSCLVLESF